MNLTKALVEHGIAVSFAQSRRLIMSKVVRLNGDITTDTETPVINGDLIEVGNVFTVSIPQQTPDGDGTRYIVRQTGPTYSIFFKGVLVEGGFFSRFPAEEAADEWNKGNRVK